MKKRTQSSSGRTSRALLSGAGAAFLAGGVAEAGLVAEAHIYSEALNITFTAPPLSFPANWGFVLGTDFQFRTTALPNHRDYDFGLLEEGVATIFQNPQAGDFVTTGGEMMGLDVQIRDWAAGSAFKFRYGEAVNGYVKAPAGPLYASQLVFWDWIGPGQTFKAGGSLVPAWTGNSGYVGFALKDGTNPLTADYYFGWMEITAINKSGLLSVTIGSYGIKTVANVGIHAGDDGNTPHVNTVGTPEPATTGLALLALGAAGVLRNRRKRGTTA